jgi:hypothetical protein
VIKKPPGQGGHSPRWAAVPDMMMMIIIIIIINLNVKYLAIYKIVICI